MTSTYAIFLTAVMLVMAFAQRTGDAAAAETGRSAATVGKAETYPDPTGRFTTINVNGPTDKRGNAFFESLGSNGRACATCHAPTDGWGLSVLHVRERYATSHGTDPLFRPFDGATCPTDDVSTPSASAKAYALLLDKGLIRIPLRMPEHAEFKIVAIDDPYNCSTPGEISVYRRPLPAANLRFQSVIMWDGREPTLTSQALNASLGHEQANSPPPFDRIKQAVAFESGLYSAQSYDTVAGDLHADNVLGGPDALPNQPFFVGINDPFGDNPTGAVFAEDVFELFRGWDDLEGSAAAERRASIARGEALFTNRPMTVIGIRGINDRFNEDSRTVSCSTCHDTPNVGNFSTPSLFNIKVSDPEQRTPDLPLFTLKCRDGESFVTSDPGEAMITGKCADIGKFKVPVLRNLAAHPPYFHNGTAKTLADVVTFYDSRFVISLSEREKADLVAFLSAL
jgi:cytochrome c peroxidase